MTPTSDPLSIDLRRDDFGRLVLRLPDGTEHVGVTPVRAFPLTAPDEWLGLVDTSGREVHAVPSLLALDAATRDVLAAELLRREFMPEIQRVLSIASATEPSIWRVSTDRGETTFELTAEENLRVLGAGAVLIVDAHGIRYRIPDVRRLDAESRRLLSRFV